MLLPMAHRESSRFVMSSPEHRDSIADRRLLCWNAGDGVECSHR